MNADLICNRLLGALLNGGYQGLLLTALVWGGLQLVPRSSAATRHAVWFATLLAVAALPILHFLVPPPEATVSAASDPGETVPPAATPELPETSQLVADEWAAVPGSIAGEGDDSESDAPSLSLAPGAPFTAVGFLEWCAGGPVLEDSLEPAPRQGPMSPEKAWKIAESPPGQPAVPTPGKAGQRASWWSRTGSVLSPGWRLTLQGPASLLVIGLWLLIALARGGNLARQCVRLGGLKRRTMPAPPELQTRFEALCQEMGLRRKTRLVVSPERTVPMLVGFHQPAVLLPGQLLAGATDTQLQHVLRHELGHALRRDDWANLVQHIIKAGLFFQPAVWWLSRRLTLEREIACDDHVLAGLGAARDYALFLMEFASRMQCRGVVAAPAAWNNKSQLKERIAMLLDTKRNSSPRVAGRSGGFLMAAIVLFAGLGLQLGPRLVLAAEAEAETDTTPPILKEEAPATPALPAVPAADAVVTAVDVSSADATLPVEATVSGDAPVALSQLVVTTASPVVVTRAETKVHPMRTVSTLSLPAPPAPIPAPGPIIAVAPGGLALASVTSPHPKRSVIIAEAPEPAPDPTTQPSAPRAGRRASKEKGDDTLERRVERLEHLMDEWLTQEKADRAATRNNNINRTSRVENDAARSLAKAGRDNLNEAELARIMKETKSTRERAVRDAERAVADARRSTAEAMAADGRMRAQTGPERLEFDTQRKMLESERRALQKQIESVEKQLDRLKETQEKLAKRSAEARGEKPGDPFGAPDKKDPGDSDDGPKVKPF